MDDIKIEKLYAEYSPPIYRLAYQMSGDEEIAKDVLQETFIKVMENISKFRSESSYFTWIYKIARNLCIDKLKRQRKRPIAALEKIIESQNRVPHEDKYGELEKRFYVNQVKDGCLLGVLRCLSFNQRMAFILNAVLFVQAKDVAVILNKTENAARILAHRARKIIKKFLCSNCSLYGISGKCKCENMINFSLSKNLIEKYNSSVSPSNTETEIKALKNEILMFQSVSPRKPESDFKSIINNYIDGSEHLIFSEKKVK